LKDEPHPDRSSTLEEANTAAGRRTWRWTPLIIVRTWDDLVLLTV